MKVRKSVAMAGTAAALAAATGLAAIPAFASASSASSASHTLRFIAHPVASHSFRAGGLEVDKDTHHGRVVAYDTLDFVSARGADVTLALSGGFLYGKLSISKMGAVTGRITGGSASYRGDMGTIRGHALAKGAAVTVKYHH
jgi:hypothetical protein